MVDVLTLELRSYNMSLIRGKNTAPELAVRRLLPSLCYDTVPILLSIDILNPASRIAGRAAYRSPSHSSPAGLN